MLNYLNNNSCINSTLTSDKSLLKNVMPYCYNSTMALAQHSLCRLVLSSTALKLFQHFEAPLKTLHNC